MHLGTVVKTACLDIQTRVFGNQLEKAIHNLNKALEWFLVECRETKTKVITLANHKEHTQYSEPIKTRSNYR